MIKLYAYPGACSLAPHIVLRELDLPHELRILKDGDKEGWAELARVNEMQQVPTIITDEGYVLTEGAAIQQYLVSRKPNSLFPEAGEARFRAFEWMNFIATTLHRGFNPLFSAAGVSDDEAHHDAIRKKAVANLHGAFKITEARFKGDYALGSQFTVVDAYLFNVLSWAGFMKVDLSPYSKLTAFMARMRERPSVIAALTAEGLLGSAR